MQYTPDDHVFAICAYKESEFLETCVLSLRQQSIPARMIMCTATPNDHISAIAEKYEIPLFINRGPHGIAEDWNFAMACAEGRLLTLAHQDDVYDPDYLRRMLAAVNGAKRPLIAFSDYYEVRNGEKVYSDRDRLLKIKEIALIPLRPRIFQSSVWMRRRVLSTCDPICCPSVTFVRENLPEVVFEAHFKSCLDWQAWEKLSRLPGSFCYVHEPLMGHRIHAGSATTEIIGDDLGRSSEDLEMYEKFWPKPIARLINRFYAAGQKSNALK